MLEINPVVLSVLVSFCAFCVGFAGLLSNNRKDVARNEANQSEKRTSLKFIQEAVTRIEINQETIRNEISERDKIKNCLQVVCV